MIRYCVKIILMHYKLMMKSSLCNVNANMCFDTFRPGIVARLAVKCRDTKSILDR